MCSFWQTESFYTFVYRFLLPILKAWHSLCSVEKTCITNRSKSREVVRKPGMCIHIPEKTHHYFDSWSRLVKQLLTLIRKRSRLITEMITQRYNHLPHFKYFPAENFPHTSFFSVFVLFFWSRSASHRISIRLPLFSLSLLKTPFKRIIFTFRLLKRIIIIYYQ